MRSLRARTTMVLVAVALVGSMVSGFAVWFSVSGYLLTHRERAAVTQAGENAAQVESRVDADGLSSSELLARLPGTLASTSLLRSDAGEWFSSDLAVTRSAIPADIVEQVRRGRTVGQRVELDGRPVLIVGQPLPGDNAYFEVFSLEELDQTLHALGLVLLAGGVLVPLLTIAAGWWAMRPALRPLDRVAEAAAAMAAGDLSARLDPRSDPALLSIASSFNATAAALERRVRRDAQFAADVSHELRSPLTTMLTTVAHLQEHRSLLPSDGRKALGLLQREVDAFGRLVEDLLEISRADAGSAVTDSGEIALAELVRQVLGDERSATVTVAPEAQDTVVRGDKRRLERVLSNLVDNAQRHGGGLTGVLVHRATGEDGPVVRLVVEDRGPGLAPDDLQRVFDRFARGQGSERGRSEGAGLGLAIVARHVATMGGRVSAGNRAGGGAQFVVELPAVERGSRAVEEAPC
ncbi:ATP-binding protein [Nocardioides sp. SYSU DS0651]|uniref:HAMP domain-containing sensor histidine kinase n=1 Tax=Nocardioides sp. SYSU DS0651 TaxID=3415955 RepID=UPI003F4B8993